MKSGMPQVLGGEGIFISFASLGCLNGILNSLLERLCFLLIDILKLPSFLTEARGTDVPQVSLVIKCDLPTNSETTYTELVMVDDLAVRVWLLTW